MTSAGVALSWSLDTTGTPYTDHFRLLAVTTAVGVTPNFTAPATAANDLCIQGNHQSLLAVQSAYNDLAESPDVALTATGPKRSTGETRDMWVSIMMPYDVTAGDAQTITLSVKGVIK